MSCKPKIPQQSNQLIAPALLYRIKMQVDFDSTYLEEDQEAQRKLKNRSKMIATHKQAVADVKMDDAQDYEALTSLYRKIFRFLLEFAPNSKPADKMIEREIAAALESVFPRVGLKSFIQLTPEEKSTQLLELARIVLGIRLFNRDEGRGGGGIDSLDKDGVMLAKVLLDDIEKEMGFFQDACNKYQKAIVKAHLYRRRKKYLMNELEKQRKEAEEDQIGGGEGGSLNTRNREAKAEAKGDKHSNHSHRHGLKSNEIFLISQLEDVNDFVIERWSQELANRRQYLNFLKSLQDEVKFIHEKLESIVEKLKLELTTIKSLVSNKSSVPKEVVYPRFDSLGTIWLQLYEEIVVMIARSNTFQTLCKYRLSFSPTLADELFGEEELDEDIKQVTAEAKRRKKEKEIKHSNRVNSHDLAEKEAEASIMGDPDILDASFDEEEYIARKRRAAQAKAGGYEEDDEERKLLSADMNFLHTIEEQHDHLYADAKQLLSEEKMKNIDKEKNAIDESLITSGATLLNIKNTPDFHLLPLEFQGFCPWTIVEARGLLVPGKPSLGIIRYENQYYVCDHLPAVQAFMKKPEYYLSSIRERAFKNPEFIHLLRLQKWFPTASIAKLLQRHEQEINNQTGQPFTKDAATETPLHFQDSYIDLNYHWNEWELRRRALKIVNLKHCKTTSQQTDQSHYRRDNDTQVYLPRTNETQTTRDKGTNPPIVTTYVEGFRGKQMVYESKSTFTSKKDAMKANMAEAKEVSRPKIAYRKAAVVKLTLDL